MEFDSSEIDWVGNNANLISGLKILIKRINYYNYLRYMQLSKNISSEKSPASTISEADSMRLTIDESSRL